MSIFLLSNETSDDEEEVGSNDEEDEHYSFIAEGRREAQERAAKKIKTSKYRSTLHVSLTSCICEQTNSQAKFIMNDMRKNMDPTSLELLLLLKLNVNMINTIHEILLAQQRRVPIPGASAPFSSSSFVTPSTNSSSNTN